MNTMKNHRELPVIPAFEHSCDGSKWGVSDFYDSCEKELTEHLKLGRKAQWTTGWYSSKKEIQSGRVSAHGDHTLTLEVMCSDDFDTEGYARRVLDWTDDLGIVQQVLDELAGDAEEDRKENQDYRGYSVIHRGRWVETFIACISPWDLEDPPGDCYHHWGWQGDCELPEAVRKQCETWLRFTNGRGSYEFELGGETWEIKEWDHEETDDE